MVLNGIAWLAGRLVFNICAAGEGVTSSVMEDVFQADPRLPVLYLRAFNQESQFFIIMGRKEQYGHVGPRAFTPRWRATMRRSDLRPRSIWRRT